MPLPLFKIFLVSFKVISKPLTGIIKVYTRNNTNRGRNIFIYLGNKLNEFEMRLNRKAINPDSTMDFVVKRLDNEIAFTKGVDIFVELFFLYGLVIALTFIEIRKNQISSTKAKERLKKIENATIENEKMVQELQLMFKDHQKAIEGLKELKGDEESKVEEIDTKLDKIAIKLEKLDKKIV